jgi:O-antigen/teichoic acid export membrane protein
MKASARSIVAALAEIRISPYAWGLASQGASSLTNLGLSLLAGRALGPDGLGTVFIGFSFYLVALGIQKAVLTNPFVSESSALDPQTRSTVTRQALTVALGGSALATAIMAAASLAIPGAVGRGLFLFIPWLGPALLQDFWRVVLFRDGQSRGGALNDTLWLVVMGLTAPFAFLLGTDWAVVACWGLGALAGALAGFVQMGSRPDRPLVAAAWWRTAIWPVGSRYLLGTILYSLGNQLLVFLLPQVIGTRALGGLRAVMVVFAPVSLIGSALALPGLPAVSRKVAVSLHQARKLATHIGIGAAGAMVAYIAVAIAARNWLLPLIFGDSFLPFLALVWPIGVAQLVLAPTIGFWLLLIALKRARELLFTQVIVSLATLGFGLLLGATSGAVGAAWGIALGSSVQGAMITLYALRLKPNPSAS